MKKHFVSEIDIRLAEFNETHPKSSSQKAEIKKYQRIFKLRDQALEPKEKHSIWDQFK